MLLHDPLGVLCHHLDIGYDTVGSTLCVEAKESIKGMYRAEMPYPTVPAMFLACHTRALFMLPKLLLGA